MRGHRAPSVPGPARAGLTVVSAKVRLAVLTILAALYPVALVAMMADVGHRTIVFWVDGGHWFEGLRLGAGPLVVLTLHSLWSFAHHRDVAAAHEEAIELLAPSAVEYH